MDRSPINMQVGSEFKSQSNDEEDGILNNFSNSKQLEKKVHFNQTVMSYELGDK